VRNRRGRRLGDRIRYCGGRSVCRARLFRA